MQHRRRTLRATAYSVNPLPPFSEQIFVFDDTVRNMVRRKRFDELCCHGRQLAWCNFFRAFVDDIACPIRRFNARF
ncbi:Uncharacterised protein [Vibrio cholerae]|nr:Uncharacterised protein [Vibrio cholerae]CSI61953.1 Uncharacterised protein [Vibrio cholerae]